jgi:ATP-dependent RNA helicase RhlE
MFQRSFQKNNFKQNRFRGGRRQFGNNRPSRSLNPSKYISRAVPIEEKVQEYQITHKFEDFDIDPRLKQNIITKGYLSPTPIQDQTIPHILNGRDVVGVANTGTGKTAAFLIPLIDKILKNHSERMLIIVPTRELAVQIEEELRAFSRSFNIYSVLCIGGASINRQMSELRRNPHVVIGTPGRLKDLINRRMLRLEQFRTIVLDEVDRMLDIGFIHDIKYIISHLSNQRQSLFFSATVSSEVNGIIQSFLKNPITISVKVKETVTGIDQDIIRVKDKNEKLLKLQTMLKQEEFTKVLIFGRTKFGVERLSISLKKSGFMTASIHGNKSQSQRLSALSQFKDNRLQVLVATDVAARGLDITDVSHVINFDEPENYTDYIHRIGRTGRANKQGKALTFVM